MCQAMLESNGYVSPSPSVLWENKYDHNHLAPTTGLELGRVLCIIIKPFWQSCK